MWDNHQALGSLANFLFALTALIASYFISKWIINMPLLPLKEVSVSSSGSAGLKHVTREEISDSIRDQTTGNFLTVDLDVVRAALGKLPWVRDASVRRTWPGSLEVKLEEHVGLARWASRGLINRQGEIFDAQSDEELPVFEGPDESAGEMVRHYAVFTELLRPLRQNIEYMKLSSRRAWRVRLANGTTLELGRDQVETRLGRYVLAQSNGMGKFADQISYVDLRYPNGFAAR